MDFFLFGNSELHSAQDRKAMKYLSVLPYITSSFSLRSTLRSFATSQRVVVGYATDVEGNLDYWNRYLSVSKVLVKETTANNGHSIRLNDGCHFVYGGDSCDRGNPFQK